VHLQHLINLSHYQKWQFHQNVQIINHENAKMSKNSPSATPMSIFGLKTGSRGTPWNSKNAGPGGSDFTKCRFCPFKWHFGLFQGGSLFHTFFVTFYGFAFYHFFHFYTFLILSLFHFFWFLDFCHFYTFMIFDTFLSIFMLMINFCHFLCLN